MVYFLFFSSRRRHTRYWRDWSSDVCSSDLFVSGVLRVRGSMSEPDGRPFTYGGQAVIEGVMMRGRRAMAVAVRHPSGQVVVHSQALDSRIYRSRWTKRPFIRGVLMLWDTLSLGMRALMYSATVAIEEEDEAGKPDKPGDQRANSSSSPEAGAGTADQPGDTPVGHTPDDAPTAQQQA